MTDSNQYISLTKSSVLTASSFDFSSDIYTFTFWIERPKSHNFNILNIGDVLIEYVSDQNPDYVAVKIGNKHYYYDKLDLGPNKICFYIIQIQKSTLTISLTAWKKSYPNMMGTVTYNPVKSYSSGIEDLTIVRYNFK